MEAGAHNAYLSKRAPNISTTAHEEEAFAEGTDVRVQDSSAAVQNPGIIRIVQPRTVVPSSVSRANHSATSGYAAPGHV